MKTILGLDFGTTTTMVGITSEKSSYEPRLIEFDGLKVVDTVIRLSETGDEVEEIGKDAWEDQPKYPDRTFSEFKPKVASDTVYSLPSGRELSARELAVKFLTEVRERIEEQHFGGEPLNPREHDTVVGYPADWTPEQQASVVSVAEEAGFPNVRGCLEPLAVLQFHHAERAISLDEAALVFVYDLGGGTSDTCLVQIRDSHSEPEVIAAGGEDVGGRNFDEVLTEHFCKSIEEGGASPITSDDRLCIRRHVRVLKEKLSGKILGGEAATHTSIPHLEATRGPHTCHLDKGTFEHISKDVIEQLDVPITEVTDSPRGKDVSPDKVIIAGGTGRFYFVRDKIKRFFPVIQNSAIINSTNPQEVVAKGLALYGLAKHRGENPQLPERPQGKTRDGSFVGQEARAPQRNAVSSNKLVVGVIFSVCIAIGLYMCSSSSGKTNAPLVNVAESILQPYSPQQKQLIEDVMRDLECVLPQDPTKADVKNMTAHLKLLNKKKENLNPSDYPDRFYRAFDVYLQEVNNLIDPMKNARSDEWIGFKATDDEKKKYNQQKNVVRAAWNDLQMKSH